MPMRANIYSYLRLGQLNSLPLIPNLDSAAWMLKFQRDFPESKYVGSNWKEAYFKCLKTVSLNAGTHNVGALNICDGKYNYISGRVIDMTNGREIVCIGAPNTGYTLSFIVHQGIAYILSCANAGNDYYIIQAKGHERNIIPLGNADNCIFSLFEFDGNIYVMCNTDLYKIGHDTTLQARVIWHKSVELSYECLIYDKYVILMVNYDDNLYIYDADFNKVKAIPIKNIEENPNNFSEHWYALDNNYLALVLGLTQLLIYKIDAEYTIKLIHTLDISDIYDKEYSTTWRNCLIFTYGNKLTILTVNDTSINRLTLDPLSININAIWCEDDTVLMVAIHNGNHAAYFFDLPLQITEL